MTTYRTKPVPYPAPLMGVALLWMAPWVGPILAWHGLVHQLYMPPDIQFALPQKTVVA